MNKGYPSQEKDDRLKAQHTTVEPIKQLQHGLSVVAHQYMRVVVADAVEAGSSAFNIVATAHQALKGDQIIFTSGAFSGREVKVESVVDANNFTLAETLSAAPAVADTFNILRHKSPYVDINGQVSASSGPIQFTRDAASQLVIEDTVAPANNRPLPVKISGPTGDLGIYTEDLASAGGERALAIVGVRNDAGISPVSADGDFQLLQFDSAGNLRTSAAAAAVSHAKVNLIRNDYSVTNVTTAAYVQLVASTAAAISYLDIFDSSGETMVFAVGAAAAEVDQFYIYPGGNGKIELTIPIASRLSVKAVSATASVGELDINCFS
jgi:hypothetical protein